MSLFSDKKINTGRQVEFDIAKALSIIFMIFVHTLIVASYFPSSVTHIYSHVVDDILGGPCAAPVFMFCMGIGVVYSRHSQWNIMIKRGVKLLILSILVDVAEFVIPHFLSGVLLNRWDLFGVYGGLILFYVDILDFAGLSFIILGLFKKWDLSNKQMLIIAVSLSLIGSFARFVDFDNNILNVFFGFFIGTTTNFTAFPLFNWIIFPISGILYGNYFVQAKDKSKFFKFWPVFIIIPLLYFIYTCIIPNTFLIDDGHYYYMTLIDACFVLLYIHGNIGFCYWVSKLLPEKIIGFMSILSRNINSIYIAQWFLIPVLVILIYFANQPIIFNDLSISLIAVLIIALSTVLALLNQKFLKKKS